jgi:anti-anti-sigma factor
MMLTFNTREENGIVILALDGKILGGPDSKNVNDFINKMIDENKLKLVIDFSQVELMNSSGLGIIIQASNILKQKNGKLKLACLPEKIKNLLQITKLNHIFESHDTIKTALSSF